VAEKSRPHSNGLIENPNGMGVKRIDGFTGVSAGRHGCHKEAPDRGSFPVVRTLPKYRGVRYPYFNDEVIMLAKKTSKIQVRLISIRRKIKTLGIDPNDVARAIAWARGRRR